MIRMRVSGLVLVGIGMGSVFGHLQRIARLSDWDQSGVGMGLSTAIVTIILGVDMFYRSLND